MITQSQKVSLKRVLQDPSWSVVQFVADELISTIQDSFVVRDSEWETAKGAVDRESQIQGIRRFIQSLYENAQ